MSKSLLPTQFSSVLFEEHVAQFPSHKIEKKKVDEVGQRVPSGFCIGPGSPKVITDL